MMAKSRGRQTTRDGMKIKYIVRVATDIGATLREGRKHTTILNYSGLRACPVVESTDARNMVAPWLAKARGCTKNEAYKAIRSGSWGK